MNFFEHQEAARRSTGRLVILFTFAVIAIMVCTYLVVAGVIAGVATKTGQSFDAAGLADPRLLAAVGLGTIGLVGSGSLYKLVQLSHGGSVVAESLGGRRLTPGSNDLVEKRLLNVVEEMAIASGAAVPPVYLLDREMGINAFAAGHRPSDAVIGVTRGCAERLSRDELQGVVAHEFSHIFNGDMRLNLRLMGVLHGILVIGILGYYLLRSSFYAGGGRRSNRDGAGGMAAILAIGAGLAAIGFLGTFFGNWIKAAVSRQREFLADASAVQFTRNPAGIAGALMKIGGLSRHATIEHPNAAQASHMFFGQAITSGLNAIFATHPPLPERIRRIEPSWKGSFPTSERVSRDDTVAGFASAPPVRSTPPRVPDRAAGTDSIDRLIASIANPSPDQIAYARELLRALPADVAAAARETFGARAVVMGLLLDPVASVRARQVERLRQFGDDGVLRELSRLLPALDGLDARLRLPLIEAAMPALAAMTRGQYDAFRVIVIELPRADQRLNLFEWCLQRIVLGELDLRFEVVRRPRVQYYAFDRLGAECAQLLSILAHVGSSDADATARAFANGARRLPLSGLELLDIEACGLEHLDDALDRFAVTAPRMRQALISAAVGCVVTDRMVTIEEAEVLRAIAARLDCPVPPLLPGERTDRST